MKAAVILLLLTCPAVIISCGQKTSSSHEAGEGVVVEEIIPASSEDYDAGLAVGGKKYFEEQCLACHTMGNKVIGPALGDVADRRTTAWLIDMIADPDKMLDNDPIAKQLLKEHNNVRMTQTATRDEAVAIVEYLKKVSQESITASP